jgi:hypothetical protein
MAKPPAGSSLLFGALADSGRIKQRKNGSYRMVLEGVDEIDWFTDRPDRVEGTWKPQKLLRKWDKYFATSEPNAQATVEVGDQRELFSFEMFKPKIKSGKMVFGVKPLSDSSEDKITGLKDMKMSDISLFIDDATPGVPSCFPYCRGADLKGWDMSGQKLYSDFFNVDLSPRGETATNLSGADLTGSNLGYANLSYASLVVADLNSADLTGADLTNANLSDASLVGANLTSADLTNADLFDASLGDADLSGADLTNADLTNAYVSDANLGNANLTNANLTGAYLFGANLTGADLTGAIWANTTCPDSYTNSGTSPCTTEQLNLA